MFSNGKEYEIIESPIPKEYELMDKYWKASNYLAVGQVRYYCDRKICKLSTDPPLSRWTMRN